MTGGEDIIALAAGFGVYAAAAAALAIASPRLTHALRRVQPDLRASLLLLLAAAPFAFGVFAAAGVAFFPHVLPLDLVPAHRHGSLSVWQGEGALTGTGIAVLVILMMAAGLVMRMGYAALTAMIETRSLRQVLERASVRSNGVVRQLATDKPVAMAVGVLNPVIYLSDAVIRQSGTEGCAIIEAHERAHLARGDLAARFVMEVLSSPLPASTRAHLHRALVLAQEQACDRAVARLHAPVQIAETLVRMERGRSVGPALSVRFDDGDIALRVRALLEPDFEARAYSLVRVIACGGMLFLAVLVALEPLHHTIESLFLAIGG